MSDQFVSVSTMLKGLFRLVEGPDSPMICANMVHTGNASLGEEALLSSRQNDATLRFLIEMDRKLDSIMGLLQRESLVADFPGEGRIVQLSGSGLVFECRQSLSIGQYMELLLLFEEMPLRLLSVMGHVEALRPGKAATGPANKAYDMTYTCMCEEDREGIIRFVFSEQRRMIRQQKSGEEG